MTDAQKGSAAGATSDHPVNDPARLLRASLDALGAMPVSPLMVHQTAAFAAATAVGFGLSTQIAGAWLGAFQGAADAFGRLSAQAASADKAPQVAMPPAAETVAAVETAAPVLKKAPARTSASDDLKRIPGIGPKTEQVLRGMGVRRYGDIARWSGEDVARIDTELGLAGRIVKDGWTAQARMLGKEARRRKAASQNGAVA